MRKIEDQVDSTFNFVKTFMIVWMLFSIGAFCAVVYLIYRVLLANGWI